jgi:glutamate-1-semialdehyde aminotransferase
MKFINLWKKAEKIIPGGNGLLSKRPKRFLPKGWPIYFSKAKGINIWDLNGKKYIDFSNMGVGTAILGYSNSFVDNSVNKKIRLGINTTLNCREEYELAKELLKHDKFAQQVKFARGGGEAMAMAIRIARASSDNKKKYKIGFSGYHGWHDWYLAANLKNKKNLNNHLLKNLNPIGVPLNLNNSIIPFKFNDSESFLNLIKKNKKDLCAIVIEGARYQYPNKNFVKVINNLINKHNICLIIDEITSGWRESLGGIYKKFNLKPGIVIYGKALGNGFAISAIVGKKKYMKNVQDTFISSTAWTERVGFQAALSTIKFFKNKKVYKHIITNGKYIISQWKKLFLKYNLQAKINDFISMPSFEFLYNSKNEYLHTYFTELMLNKGYLSTNNISITYSHKKRDIDKYLKNVDLVLKRISKELKIDKLNLKSPVRTMSY